MDFDAANYTVKLELLQNKSMPFNGNTGHIQQCIVNGTKPVAVFKTYSTLILLHNTLILLQSYFQYAVYWLYSRHVIFLQLYGHHSTAEQWMV